MVGHMHMVSIGVAAAELGVSTATLRKWESRYGLALSSRSAKGARSYSEQDISRLRLAKRQMDAGVRPADVFGPHAAASWPAQAHQGAALASESAVANVVNVALELLLSHQLDACHAWLSKACGHHGLEVFVDEIAGPLATAVGDAWARGAMQVFEEHGFTAVLRAVLDKTAFGTDLPHAHPTVLMATLSGERHTLGLAMLQGVLREAGVRCINLGSGLPEAELVAAAAAFGAQVVALSLSTALPPRVTARQLTALRQALPCDVAVWVGGAGVGSLARLPRGVRLFSSCAQARSAVQLLWPRVAVAAH